LVSVGAEELPHATMTTAARPTKDARMGRNVRLVRRGDNGPVMAHEECSRDPALHRLRLVVLAKGNR